MSESLFNLMILASNIFVLRWYSCHELRDILIQFSHVSLKIVNVNLLSYCNVDGKEMK